MAEEKDNGKREIFAVFYVLILGCLFKKIDAMCLERRTSSRWRRKWQGSPKITSERIGGFFVFSQLD
jgi:hypothetical protein